MGHRQSRPDHEPDSADTTAHAGESTELVSHAITLDTMSTTSTIYSFAGPLARGSVQSVAGRPSVEVASRTPRPSFAREAPDSASVTPAGQSAAAPTHDVTPEEEDVTPVALASTADLEAQGSQAALAEEVDEGAPQVEDMEDAADDPLAAFMAEERPGMAPESSARSFAFDHLQAASAVTLAPTLSTIQSIPTAEEEQQEHHAEEEEEVEEEEQDAGAAQIQAEVPAETAPEQAMPQAPYPTPAASEAPEEAAVSAEMVASPAPARVSAFATAPTAATSPVLVSYGVPPIPEDSTTLATPADESSGSPVTPQGFGPHGSLTPGQMSDSPQMSTQESDGNSFRSTPVYVNVKLVQAADSKMAKAVSLELVPRKDSDDMPLAVKLVPLNTAAAGLSLGSGNPAATQKVHPAKDLISSPSLDTAIEKAILPLVQGAAAAAPGKLHSSVSFPSSNSPEAAGAAETAEKSVPRSFSMRNASGKTLTRQLSKRVSTLTRSVSMRVQSALCVKPTPVK